MKKLTAILLAMILVLSLSIVAVAAETTGSITIDNAEKGQEYHLYKLADLESFSGNNYSYKFVVEWKDFFLANPDYFEIVGEYVRVKDDAEPTAEQRAKLAKDAQVYAKQNGIAAAASETATGDTVVFADLPLGYYMLDTSKGTLCTLDTSTQDLTIYEKNADPTIDKFVEEDSKMDDGIDNNEWGKVADADMYQTVNFKVLINAQSGAENYTMYDNMTGLSLIEDSIKVFDGDVEVAATNYTVVTDVKTGSSTLTILFKQSFCDTLEDDQQLIVTYSAFMDENSVIGGNGNKNKVWLTYGQGATTPTYETTCYLYEFDIIKTDAAGTLLSGAKFKLYDAPTGGHEIPVVKEADGSYRLAKEGETGVEIEVAGGKVTVSGLDGSTDYHLEETAAPAGYNKLSARQTFTITSENLKASMNGTDYDDGGVQVVNKTGSELPETGGLGTLLFTLLGGGTVLGSGVLLVTKKRMSKIEE